MSETPAEKMARLANEKADHHRRQIAEREQERQRTLEQLAAQDAVDLRRVLATVTDTFVTQIAQALEQHVHPSGTALTFSVIAFFFGVERNVLNELSPLFEAIERAGMQPFTLRQRSSNGCYSAGTENLLGRVHSGPGRPGRWDRDLDNGGFLSLTSPTPLQPHDPPIEFGWLPKAQYAHKSGLGNDTIAVGARWAQGPVRETSADVPGFEATSRGSEAAPQPRPPSGANST